MEGGHWCEQDFIFIFFLANDDLWKNKWPQVTCVETLIPVEMNYEVGIAEAWAQGRPPCFLGLAPDLWPQGMMHTLFSFVVKYSTPNTIYPCLEALCFSQQFLYVSRLSFTRKNLGRWDPPRERRDGFSSYLCRQHCVSWSFHRLFFLRRVIVPVFLIT